MEALVVSQGKVPNALDVSAIDTMTYSSSAAVVCRYDQACSWTVSCNHSPIHLPSRTSQKSKQKPTL